MLSRGKIITYVDPNNDIHPAILQQDAELGDEINCSTWSFVELDPTGQIVLTPVMGVVHSSNAGGPPYWTGAVPENA